MLSRTHTQHLPSRPNWYPPAAAEPADGFVAPTASQALYDAEVPASGPAGTVAAFQPYTLPPRNRTADPATPCT
jgi:hypothetical protein